MHQKHLLISDGCCGADVISGGSSINAKNLRDLLRNTVDSTQFNTTDIDHGGFVSNGLEDFELNTSSPYAASFTSFPIMKGGVYRPITGFPSDNVLYKKGSRDIGVFVPRSQSYNNGSGACIFAISDLSPFFDNVYNPGNEGILKPFMKAATDTNGSCARSIAGTYVTAEDDTNSTTINTPLTATTVFANDKNFDGSDVDITTTSPLSYDSNTNPTNSSVTFNPDDTYTYTPNTGFLGTATFTYTVKNSDGAKATATVTITVAGIGSTIQATDDTNSTTVDTPVTGTTVFANDKNFDASNTDVTASSPLSYVSNTNPTNGTAVFNNDGTYTYTPNTGFSGTDTFTYTVKNNDGATATAAITITISAPTPPPPTPNPNPNPNPNPTQPKPAEPVPHLSFVGLLVLVSTMTSVAFYRRRRSTL